MYWGETALRLFILDRPVLLFVLLIALCGTFFLILQQLHIPICLILLKKFSVTTFISRSKMLSLSLGSILELIEGYRRSRGDVSKPGKLETFLGISI